MFESALAVHTAPGCLTALRISVEREVITVGGEEGSNHFRNQFDSQHSEWQLPAAVLALNSNRFILKS